MELWQAYDTIKKRWFLILAVTLVAILAAWAVVSRQEPVYVSTTTINTGVARDADWYGTNVQMADMQAVLLSRFLLTALDDELQLNKPRTEIEEAIYVSRVGESSVLRLDVHWNDPGTAQASARALARMFIDYQNGQRQIQAQNEAVLLEEQLRLVEERLARAQESVPTTGLPTDPAVRAAEEELVAARQSYFFTLNNLESARAMADRVGPGTTMTIIDEASLPLEPESNKMVRTLVFGTMLGAFLGVFLSVGMEYLNPNLRVLDILEKRLGVPVLAVVPWKRHLRGRRNREFDRLAPAQREAIRLLRSNVLSYRKPAVPSRDAPSDLRHLYAPMSVMVASDHTGSGCSTIAAALATSAANIGQRVLLIDTNFDDPALHLFLQQSRSPGISEWLEDPGSLVGRLIVESRVPNLFLLASGERASATSDQLATSGLEDLIEKLSVDFNLIILDSPALNRSSDARLLRDAVDGIVLVFRPRGSRDDERLRQAVHFASDKLIGVVLNGVEVEGSIATGLSSPKLSPATTVSEQPSFVTTPGRREGAGRS